MSPRKGFTKGRIDVITLGCSKNLVDSERLMRRLEAKGYEMHHDSDNVSGEIVVVNTCGFIGDAKEESINMILELGEEKRCGRIGELVVMGCLSERNLSELSDAIPEVDRWYGKFDWVNLIDTLPELSDKVEKLPAWERTLTTQPWSAYLKISEGCNRFCAFCAIPLITGRHKSRPIDEIVAEVKSLVARGVKEFNIICQDLSSYGTDLYGIHSLAHLIDTLAVIPGVEWLRLHYGYPSDFPLDALDAMARHDNVCKYLDIALQHISDKVLANMHRHITSSQTRELIAEIRRRVPDIKLRTTLMVGFPGEGEKEFDELMKFVEETRFDRMGAFAYCEEEGTAGARLFEDSVPQEVKQQRLDRLMSLQSGIADELNEQMIGKRVKVLLEREEDDLFVGRTQFDSPEVDPEIYLRKRPEFTLSPGDFCIAQVTGYDFYDLTGEIVGK